MVLSLLHTRYDAHAVLLVFYRYTWAKKIVTHKYRRSRSVQFSHRVIPGINQKGERVS